MNLEFKKELPIIGIVLTPFVYLALIWNSLPEKVPVHWNFKGEIDQWGSKFALLFLVLLLPVLMYFLLLAASKIDPKKRISLMGRKFYQLRFFLILFMSVMASFFIYIAKNQSFSSPNLIYVAVGILLIIFGNYFKVIQPNYFIGIRTPWTLENQQVWKATHAFAGKLWLAAGFVIILGGLIFPGFTFSKPFIGIGVAIAIIPMIYSYFKFKSLDDKE
ncbi:SdpI family protein [Flavobacterium sp. KACC 22761]|uniref:SdpI family protein n=1 Tax=Flavobacterium sp. KACC 22761 TaxID=3092665 RepID=UPI002A750306|nr:SdpI family protein [Flavobacterium sp. KACC 22761]WPO79057.1 SdpI family protein [Flavobacterium sp. KACC 22761]